MSIVRPYEPGIARCLRRMISCAAAIGILLLAAGCAGKAGLQGDGSYILDRGEQSMDCQRLSNSLWGRVQVLRGMPDRVKAERAAVAPTAFQAFGRMFGASSQGLQNLKEYDRERAHIRSLHRQLIEKGCTPIDVEKEIAATDAAIAEYRK